MPKYFILIILLFIGLCLNLRLDLQLDNELNNELLADVKLGNELLNKFSQDDDQQQNDDQKFSDDHFKIKHYISQRQNLKMEQKKRAVLQNIVMHRPAVGTIKEGELTLFIQDDDEYQDGKDMYLKLNHNSLFFVQNKNSNINQILGDMELLKIITDEDNTEAHKCCDNVSKVYDDVEHGRCFTMKYKNGKKQWKICQKSNWKLSAEEDREEQCKESLEDIVDWREKIVTEIIVQDCLKKGVSCVGQLDETSSEWTWKEQYKWTGECNTGQAQSPLLIHDQQTIETKFIRMLWGYTPCRDCRVQFNGHEQEIIGNFGPIQIKDYLNKKTEHIRHFNATKITFKFPPEHQLLIQMNHNIKFDGEMLIHHENEEGQKAIISVFLLGVQKSEQNKFLDDLKPDQWNFNGDNVCLADNMPNLDDIEYIQLDEENQKTQEVLKQHPETFDQPKKDGADINFLKNFYFYMGSDTTPPCEEMVERYVMMQYLKVSDCLLDVMKFSSHIQKVETKGNSRQHQQLNRRVIYKSMCKDCMKPVNEVNHNQNKPKEPEVSDEPALAWFVRSNLTVSNLWVNPFPQLVGKLDNNTSVEYVDQDEVPQAARKKGIEANKKFLDQLKKAGKMPFQFQNDALIKQNKENFVPLVEQEDEKVYNSN